MLEWWTLEHKKPIEGSECAICCCDIDETNYVEYKVNDCRICDSDSFLATEWIPCIVCEQCVELFITTMMPTYLKNLLEADCRASQLRVLAQGPPVYVSVIIINRSYIGWFGIPMSRRKACWVSLLFQ